jgi:hypothetical protein
VTAALLLAAALGAAPGCPEALARARGAADPGALAGEASAIVARLERAGAGGPTRALREAAARAAAAGPDRAAAGSGFLGALERHCALAAAPRVPLPGADERAALEAVLGRPEFRHARLDPGALRRALLAAWAAALDLLGSAEAERYASFGRTVLLTAVAAAAAVLWAVARRRSAARRREPAPPAAAIRPPPQDLSAALAEGALARGDAAGAIRHAFLAALAALERSGRLPPGRALTNREIVAAVERDPADALGPELSGLAAAFDRTVYGARAASLDDARAALERARRVGALAQEGAR